jgi:hypothetical protein
VKDWSYVSTWPTPPLEARAAVLPATRPCSGCRLAPSSGSGRTGALAVR